jgi:hypothetical protein
MAKQQAAATTIRKAVPADLRRGIMEARPQHSIRIGTVKGARKRDSTDLFLIHTPRKAIWGRYCFDKALLLGHGLRLSGYGTAATQNVIRR